ncbi:MAG: hypothetical protein M2R46_05440 [Verrucomicrobia subdivision 3 bacterium]|nr:hypothetical protein [Limisphaerales bacterium]
MKDQYPRISRDLRRHEKIERKNGHRVPLEAPYPGFGPPVFFTESVGQIDLGRSEIGQCPIPLGVEFVHHELHGIRAPAED